MALVSGPGFSFLIVMVLCFRLPFVACVLGFVTFPRGLRGVALVEFPASSQPTWTAERAHQHGRDFHTAASSCQRWAFDYFRPRIEAIRPLTDVLRHDNANTGDVYLGGVCV